MRSFCKKIEINKRGASVRYEDLLSKYDDKLIIKETDLPPSLKGLCADNVILISNDLSSKQKLEVLGEEIAHYEITYGDIRNQNNEFNKKMEFKARRHSYELVISLDDLIKALKTGIELVYEISEYFEVSIEYFLNVIAYYKSKYVLYVDYGKYRIYFEPLSVTELELT